ncbi:hypothetical protein CERSUDRAFT_117472 [Gelatoporia subvermispora B]|uniref:Uncharacterized protein n=1 Tax=Ceriporiopsis subvermispora (strain B) TaxID=914234 RepID=M2PDQ7_CERS8|nr:hypothetical protein CERSUDRAFT_117472 [Gelatoporia subvermispora B]
MSRMLKELTLARLEDLTLGSFTFVPTSATLDHLVRFLSTWSGSDKLFQVLQYTIKLLVPFLRFRARLQHRAGLRKAPASTAADGLSKLDSLMGDARMLFRFWGLFPIIQWLSAIERNPPPTRKLLTIERLQGWSMLAYYPLEHLYYLVSHSIIPAAIPAISLSALLAPKGSAKSKHVTLNAGSLALWSCRFWAIYVVLQFVHLREDMRLLKLRQRSLGKAKTSTVEAEKAELKKRRNALWTELVANIGNFPLTIHWSLQGGIFKNEVWVGVFGLIAALASWRSGWNATELPAVSPTPGTPDIGTEKDIMNAPLTQAVEESVFVL